MTLSRVLEALRKFERSPINPSHGEMTSQHHKLDLISEPPRSPAQQESPPEPSAGSAGRPFIGIEFTCCGRYARIYQNREGTYYVGNCPKCAKPVRLRIGTGGSDSRFFTVY